MASRRADRLQQRNRRKEIQEDYERELASLEQRQGAENDALDAKHQAAWHGLQRRVQIMYRVLPTAPQEEQEEDKTVVDNIIEAYQEKSLHEVFEMGTRHRMEKDDLELTYKKRMFRDGIAEQLASDSQTYYYFQPL
jgi:hypothetical protein